MSTKSAMFECPPNIDPIRWDKMIQVALDQVRLRTMPMPLEAEPGQQALSFYILVGVDVIIGQDQDDIRLEVVTGRVIERGFPGSPRFYDLPGNAQNRIMKLLRSLLTKAVGSYKVQLKAVEDDPTLIRH